MPIKIARSSKSGGKAEEIDWLCDDDWELPIQVNALNEWLKENSSLASADYYADIGYSVRREAFGGGCMLTLDMMEILLKLGMEVCFSEYPWSDG